MTVELALNQIKDSTQQTQRRDCNTNPCPEDGLVRLVGPESAKGKGLVEGKYSTLSG